MALAGLSRLRPPYRMDRPKPNFHLLIHTLAGRGRGELAGRKVGFSPGELWLVPAGVPTDYSIHGPRWDIFWFHLRDLPRWAGLRERGPGQLDPGQSPKVPTLMNWLVAEAHSTQPDREEMARHFASALGIFLDRRLDAQLDPQVSARRHRLGELWSRVSGELARDWQVSDLAGLAHLSPTHFHRLVREYYGVSPLAYVRNLRLERARELLAKTDYTLEAIAALVGYQTPYALAKVFKRETGRAPGQYRAGRRSPVR